MSPIQIVYNSKSWQDFERRLSKLEFNKRGLVFEWLCVFYLQIEPRYKTSYKRVLHSSEYLKDNEIKRKLGLLHNEQGTDIIGETFEGKIEIIQCKYKNNKNKNINAKDINDPIRIASGREARKWVDTILVCSNLKGFTKNKTLDELDIQFRTVLEGNFRELTTDSFENIRRVIDKKIPIYKSKTPFEHQKIAVANAKEHFKNSKKGKIIHACGTGKTLTSYFVFRELKSKLTLYIVPGLQLINQALIEWTKESLADESPISPFVVCSDKSNEKIGECEPELWLQELGIKVSNKKEDLEIFLKSRRKNKVIFSTYQSGKILAKNIRALNKQIDLAFFDEAHNTATSKDKLSAHLLWDKNIPIKKRLFMTATPKQFVGNTEKFTSMDNAEIYGELIDEITVKEAIEGIGGRKLLNDYQIITQIVKKDSYIELLADNPFVVDKVKLPEKVELKLLASAITLKKIRKDKNIKNIVSFHGRRNRANAFRKGAKKLDDGLNTFYVDGKQSGTERNNILEDFTNNPPSLIANARCLSEGVNVPSIDAIMFVDPKQSRVDITQAIGRALRKGKKEKGTSYIIIPTIVDKDNPDNIEEAYQQILMVLRSMSEHDGRIVEYFRLVREGKKPIKNFLEVNSEYLPEEFDLQDFSEKLHFKAWNRVAQLGRRPWEQAREWARSLGLKSRTEWSELIIVDKIPVDIPLAPDQTYRKEWTSWSDFLDTINIAYTKRKRWTYQQHLEFIQKQKLKSTDEYKLFCKGEITGKDSIPAEMYTNPDKEFPNDFPGWASFLGYVGISHGRWRSHDKARDFARKLQLNTVTEWRSIFLKGLHKKFPTRPIDIPAKPQKIYHEFIDWYDFLGIEPTWRAKTRTVFFSYAEAKVYLKEFNLKNENQYEKWYLIHKPKMLPFSAKTYYSHSTRKEWVSWFDFLSSEQY